MDRIFKEKICVICENIYIPTSSRQKCCSKECSNIYSKQNKKEIHREKTIHKRTKTCKKCGIIFIAHRTDIIFCSKKCKQEQYKIDYAESHRISSLKYIKNNPEKRKECAKKSNAKTQARKREERVYTILVCPICNTSFINKNKRKYCSKECCRKAIEIKKKSIIKIDVYKECVICKKQFIACTKNKKVCSEECRKISIKNSRKKGVHSRKAKEKNVICEEIDYQLVRERCGDRCYVCNKKLDFSLKHPHPMCPTIEHIYPVNLGGGVTYSNITYSHLICNIKKSDKIPETGLQQYLNFA